MTSRARAMRLDLDTPWIASGKATLSSTLRCGSRAKFWNTIPILWRRISIISRSPAFSRSRPSNRTSPAVGSIRRDRQRSRVDLPEPLRPMTMKISPSGTSRLTSRTAPTRPAAASASASGVARSFRKVSASWPNSFQIWRQESFTGCCPAPSLFRCCSANAMSAVPTAFPGSVCLRRNGPASATLAGPSMCRYPQGAIGLPTS